MLERTSATLILSSLVWACGTPAPQLETDGSPADTIRRLSVATDDRLAQLDRLDVASHNAQLDHHLARIAGGDEKTREPYLRAENALNQSLVSAWEAIPTVEAGANYLVDGPLMLTMLDYQIELRRFLGPNFHTRVEGLRDDPGCAGDLVQDRLAWRFGAAAQAIHALAGSHHPTIDPLNRWAHQVVCVSDAQLAQLDYAMDLAFESVTGRMRHRGLERLIAPMARIVAPLSLLVVDARKHRGEHSRAWHWFDRHRAQLRAAVGSAGWVGGDVMVWDRRLGVLVGFGPCAVGRAGLPSGSCVDVGMLLDSLADPRSVGLGQCGLWS